MFEDYRFILGSGSPRRRQLLGGLGIPFEVEPVKGDPEVYDSSMPFDQVPEFLARHKSSCFGRPLADYEVLITADTMVCLDGQLLGKPEGREEACEMLRRLGADAEELPDGIVIRGGKALSQGTADPEFIYFAVIVAPI